MSAAILLNEFYSTLRTTHHTPHTTHHTPHTTHHTPHTTHHTPHNTQHTTSEECSPPNFSPEHRCRHSTAVQQQGLQDQAQKSCEKQHSRAQHSSRTEIAQSELHFVSRL
jgi:hypothetical protein